MFQNWVCSYYAARMGRKTRSTMCEQNEGLAQESAVECAVELAVNKDLFEAIGQGDVSAVKLLLSQGASLTHREPIGEANEANALTYAIAMLVNVSPPQVKALEVTKEVIAAAARAENKRDILDDRDSDADTALCWALKGPVLEIIQALVKAGASLENINGQAHSALHVASASSFPDNLKFFLDNMTQLNIQNTAAGNKASFPIHMAAAEGQLECIKLLLEKLGAEQLAWRDSMYNTALHSIAYCNSIKKAQYLLQNYKYYIPINSVNKVGETPLFIAARHKYAELATLFLQNGASMSVEGEAKTAVKQLASNFSDPLLFFENIFNRCIQENWDKLFIDYAVLVERKGRSQIKVIEQLQRWGGPLLLKHPLIESLIYMKWKCLLPLFYVTTATYAMFLMAFNVFVIVTFNKIDSSNKTACSDLLPEVPCVEGCGWLHWMLVAFVYIGIGVLFIQECVWISLRSWRYFDLVEAWMRLTVLILAASIPPAVGCIAEPDSLTLPRHVTCLVLLLAWLEAPRLMSRFSGWGYYAFERAAINLSKILLMAICFVSAFATCFMIYYQSKPPFNSPYAAFLKTLVMMTSEFDYQDLFNENRTELAGARVAVHLLFVLFVIFIAIALMTFMTGVAVSDVKELYDTADIRRLKKQVQILSTVECLGDTLLGKRWKRLSRLRVHDPMYSQFKVPGRQWKTHRVFSTNEEDDIVVNFTSELHNAIYDVAMKNKIQFNDGVRIKNNVKQYHVNDMKDFKLSDYCDTEMIDKHKETKIVDELNMVIDRIMLIENTNKEIKQSIDDFKNDIGTMTEILVTLVSAISENKTRVSMSW
ncbi:transient receptor potential channel pyrexia-like isoform X2 [Cydia pomonella]|uniref:transient receptor potential channel pyrexia-like isoform X2 n=1 Tax=Cydia pomonella TaxID=82600 RepID=UPI002ADDF5D9|nr:transient receptor potential channel pyrexia-like isoform X2 [Cydia pomonella]